MKRFVLSAFIVLLSLSTFAQGKYGADSVKCVQNLSLYKDYYKQKIYDQAYKFWRLAYIGCPQSSEKMYVDGFNLVENQLKQAKTKEEKAAYIDTLLSVYDQRIQYFGKKGYVLGRKGTDMLRYASEDIEGAYNTLKTSIELQADKSEAGAIVSYMTAVVEMEKKESLTSEEVVKVFSQLNGFLDQSIQKYDGNKLQEYYVRAQEAIGNIASPYLSCDVLVKMAEDNYEKNKDNQDWLKQTASLLQQKKCLSAPIFFTIAKTMHEVDPSANSAYSLGVLSLENNQNGKAAEYFNQAINIAKEGDDTYSYYIALAQAYTSMGDYGQARAAARNASKIKPAEGLPYLMIGNMIAGSSSKCSVDDQCVSKAIFWLAEDYYNKAKSVDPSIADKANSRIATNKKYFPNANDCFFKSVKAGDSVKIDCWVGESTKARF